MAAFRVLGAIIVLEEKLELNHGRILNIMLRFLFIDFYPIGSWKPSEVG